MACPWRRARHPSPAFIRLPGGGTEEYGPWRAAMHAYGFTVTCCVTMEYRSDRSPAHFAAAPDFWYTPGVHAATIKALCGGAMHAEGQGGDQSSPWRLRHHWSCLLATTAGCNGTSARCFIRRSRHFHRWAARPLSAPTTQPPAAHRPRAAMRLRPHHCRPTALTSLRWVWCRRRSPSLACSLAWRYRPNVDRLLG